MALLTVDKIAQLRTQLGECTSQQTAAALKVAIARLEAQIHPPASFVSETLVVDEILQPLINKGSIKIYDPGC